MAQIAVFHSVLGVRPGVLDAADRLREQGHDVLTVDQYDDRVFDDDTEAEVFVQQLGGYPRLMATAVEAVKALPDGFLCLGFSNGGGRARSRTWPASAGRSPQTHPNKGAGRQTSDGPA